MANSVRNRTWWGISKQLMGDPAHRKPHRKNESMYSKASDPEIDPMATDAQIDANRRNAAKSTGPKTEEGKAKIRLNALKHGGRAKTTDVMPVLPHEEAIWKSTSIDARAVSSLPYSGISGIFGIWNLVSGIPGIGGLPRGETGHFTAGCSSELDSMVRSRLPGISWPLAAKVIGPLICVLPFAVTMWPFSWSK